jgi:galactose mutarotase-like enzyme
MSSVISDASSVGATERVESVALRSVDGSTEAEFVPDANMICSSLRYLGEEYLHRGDGVGAYLREGKTMGIPLLHPWANRLNGFRYRVACEEVALPRGERLIFLDDVGLPMHGAAPALMRWEVVRLSATSLTARLRWTSGVLLRLFPFPHELTVDATVESGALTIVTTLAPIGEKSVPVSFGYHPYLRIPEEERSEWRVTLGARERLLLDDAMPPRGARAPAARQRFTLAEQVLDDGFGAVDVPAAFQAAAGDVALTVGFLEGYSYAQVFAPAGTDFICFEPMTAPTNALVSGDGLELVAPRDQYRAAFRVSISGASRSDAANVVR